MQIQQQLGKHCRGFAGGWSCSRRPGLSWASSCLLQAALMLVCGMLTCQEPEGNRAAELLLVSPLHKCSIPTHPIPSLPPWVVAECGAHTHLTSQVLWGESQPHHKLGGICKGRAHTVWQARLCLWLDISTQPQEESPEEIVQGLWFLHPSCLVHLEEYSSSTCLGKV